MNVTADNRKTQHLYGRAQLTVAAILLLGFARTVHAGWERQTKEGL